MQPLSNIRTAAAVGLTGIAVFSICWICAVVSDSSWIFGVNMSSDLGVSDTNAHYFFNYGCMSAGILIYIYGILAAYFSGSTLDRISYVLIALAGMFLIGVGIFTEDVGWPHNLCAYSLFISISISALIRLILYVIYKNTLSAVVTAVLILLIVVIALTQTFPFLEASAVILIMIWIALNCLISILEMKKEGFESKVPT